MKIKTEELERRELIIIANERVLRGGNGGITMQAAIEELENRGYCRAPETTAGIRKMGILYTWE